MARIGRGFVKLPIDEVLRHYGGKPPRRSNGWRKMKCCFHDDSHASASLNFDTEYFICFACDMKGDGINLIKEKEGFKNYNEAYEYAETILDTSAITLQQSNRTGSRLSRVKGSNSGGRQQVPLGRRGRTIPRT
jgi:DNA primase